jgi:DNA-binding PadR family transcriptional regulator
MRTRPEELAIGEWAVLALLAEGPTHGFALARTLESDGEVGQVWTMKRPLVYHTVERLVELGLAARVGTAAGAGGPRRRVVAATPAGRRRVTRWLRQPVGHLRDARSLLMLKLLFIERRDADPGSLLVAQRERFAVIERTLAASMSESEGFARTLLLWRLENVRAALRFVDELMPA